MGRNEITSEGNVSVMGSPLCQILSLEHLPPWVGHHLWDAMLC